MESRFIRVHNKLVHIDAISYVEFLESGRAMIIAHSLPPEKQHIQVDEAETRRLREALDPLTRNVPESSLPPAVGSGPQPVRRFFHDR